jgi:DNA-binding NarL/FixJ family response regulator
VVETKAASVLIVDDQATFRDTAAAVVDAVDGLCVREAVSSGEAAIELLEHEPCGLVLMDVQMPGIGGIAAAQVVQARFPDTVVILMSVTDSCHVRLQAERLQLEYISKAELGPERLERCWREHSGRRVQRPDDEGVHRSVP